MRKKKPYKQIERERETEETERLTKTTKVVKNCKANDLPRPNFTGP